MVVYFKLAYLEVPLLFKVPFSTGPTKPYVIGGPTIGYMMSSKVEVSVLGVKAEEDVKDYTKSLDYGVVFGAGVSFQTGNTTVFVEGRYALGLANVYEEQEGNGEEDDVPIEPDVKTRGIHIVAGVTFPLGGQ